MWRPWVWIMAIGLVLAGGAWKSEAGDTFYLGKLKSVCVPPAVFATETKELFGLSEEAIADHVYVWLKGKLPRLVIERNEYQADRGACSPPAPALSIVVNLRWARFKGGAKVGYFGHVKIMLIRWTLWEGEEPGAGISYVEGSVLMGNLSTVVSDVKEALDDVVLTNFAAEYYKAGNP